MPPPDSTNGEVDTFVVRDHRRSPLSGLRSRTSRMFDMLGEIPIDSRCYDIYGFAIYGIASSRSRTKKGQRRIDDFSPPRKSAQARIWDCAANRAAFTRRDPI